MLNRPDDETLDRIVALNELEQWAWHDEYGVTGLFRFLFTYGILAGCSTTGYAIRWCYNTRLEAVCAFTEWHTSLAKEPTGYTRRLPEIE